MLQTVPYCYILLGNQPKWFLKGKNDYVHITITSSMPWRVNAKETGNKILESKQNSY